MNKFIYVSKGILNRLDNGWLKLHSVMDQEIKVPYSTKLQILDKYYLLIKEGIFAGTVCFIPTNFNSLKYLDIVSDKFEYSHSNILFNQTNNSLKIDMDSYENIETENRIQDGIYKLEIPSFDINKTPINYFDESKGGSRLASLWFRIIGNSIGNNTFMHYGTYSNGCITFKHAPGSETGKHWTKLALRLMETRLDSLYLTNIVIYS